MKPVKKHLSFFTFNVEGLCSKLEDPSFINCLNKFDVIVLLETWLPHGFQVNVPGFSSFSTYRRKHRKAKRCSGGLTILIKESLRKGVKFLPVSSDFFIWFKLDSSFFHTRRDIFVCATYIPPKNSSIYSSKDDTESPFLTLQSQLLSFSRKGNIIICGDFNARTGNLKDFLECSNFDSHCPIDDLSDNLLSRNNRDSQISAFGRLLVETCIAFNLIILNGRTRGDFSGQFTCFTPNGSSVIDYAMVNKELFEYISFFAVNPPSFNSCHSPLTFALLLDEVIVDKSGDSKLRDFPTAFRWDPLAKECFLSSLKSDSVSQSLESLNYEVQSNNIDSINDLVNDFTEIIIDTAKATLRKKHKLFPKTKKSNIKPQKWYDKSCWSLKKEINLVSMSVLRNPTCPILRGRLFSLKKSYRKLIKFKKAQFKSSLLTKIQTLESSNPKEYWKLIKSLRSISEKNKSKTTSPTIEADEWYTHFRDLNKVKETINSSSFEKEVNCRTSNLNTYATPSNETLDKPFTKSELIEQSKKLKNNKASGLDVISNEMVKCCVEVHCDYLVKLFNSILQSGVFPQCWNDGYISPIFKSGSSADPNNYRGISINSCLGKFFTLILNSRLTLFLEENDVIKPNQIGFRKNFRTADHIFVVKTITDLYFKQGKKVYACFVDFRKAYDSVWRNGLLYKLIKIGVSKTFIKLLSSMYQNIKSSVKTPEGLTDTFNSSVGVKQGCNLSPNLFNIFLNDLCDNFLDNCDPIRMENLKLNCLMYADDLLLLSETQKGLQRSLDRLYHYTRKWKLSINISKTKIMVFNKSGRKLDINCTFGKDQVPMTRSYQYLGTTLTPSGSFNLNIENLYNKGLRVVFSLMKVFHPQYGTPVKTLLKLFNLLIQPVILYSCEVWGGYSKRTNSPKTFKDTMFKINLMCEKLHLKMCKMVLGVHSKSTNSAVLAELGRFPLHISIYTQIVKFYFHLLECKSSIILNKALQVSRKLNHNGTFTWFTTFSNLLRSIDLSLNDDIRVLQLSVRGKLQQLFINEWQKSRQEIISGGRCSKLDLYSKIKCNYKFEEYLNQLPNFQVRRAVTQLRISAHQFPVEKGRYYNIPREQRICNFCTLYEIGDETHYLSKCSHWEISEIRRKFVKDLTHVNPSFTNFDKSSLCIYTISMNDESVNMISGTFIHNVMELYSTLIIRN